MCAAVRGRKGGRKPVIVPENPERARVMVARGLTVLEAATRLKVGKTALYAALEFPKLIMVANAIEFTSVPASRALRALSCRDP